MGKKTIFLIFVLIILFISTTTYFIFQLSSETSNERNEDGVPDDRIEEKLSVPECNDVDGLKEKSECIAEYALLLSDYRLCGLIEREESWGNDKYHWCMNVVIIETKEFELCELIERDRTRDYCQRGWDWFYKVDNSWCENMFAVKEGDEFSYQVYNGCKKNFAVAYDNSTLCEEIYDGYNSYIFDYRDVVQKDYCFYRIAGNTKDVALCSRVNDSWLADICREVVSR